MSAVTALEQRPVPSKRQRAEAKIARATLTDRERLTLDRHRARHIVGRAEADRQARHFDDTGET